MKADFKISSKDIINEYKSASSKSAVGKILGISYSKVIKTLLSAGIDIEDELADNICIIGTIFDNKIEDWLFNNEFKDCSFKKQKIKNQIIKYLRIRTVIKK